MWARFRRVVRGIVVSRASIRIFISANYFVLKSTALVLKARRTRRLFAVAVLHGLSLRSARKEVILIGIPVAPNALVARALRMRARKASNARIALDVR